MKTPCHSSPGLRDAIDVDGTRSGYLIGAEHRSALCDLLHGSAIATGVENLRGRSVLIASADPFLVALALIEFDGLARRMTLYPPDLALEHLPYVMRYAEVDAVVSDGSAIWRSARAIEPSVSLAKARRTEPSEAGPNTRSITGRMSPRLATSQLVRRLTSGSIRTVVARRRDWRRLPRLFANHLRRRPAQPRPGRRLQTGRRKLEDDKLRLQENGGRSSRRHGHDALFITREIAG